MPTPDSIERLHLVINPASTRLKRPAGKQLLRAQLDELSEASYGSRLPTSDEFIYSSLNPTETAERLDAVTGEGSVIMEAGGDGLLKDDTKTIIKYSQSPATKAAVRFWIGGGFANNGARQLNSMRALRRPSSILEHGKVVSFHPQEWSITTDGETEIDYSNLYGGLGGAALAAHVLNEPWVRNLTGQSWLGKTIVTWAAANSSNPFEVAVPSGRSRTLYELLISNGSSIAQFKHCFPNELTHASMFHCETNQQRPLFQAWRFLRRYVPGEVIKEPFTVRLRSEAYLQLDGQARLVADGSTITARRAPEITQVYSELLM